METLPGLNEDESRRLQSQAELGLQFDDEMRGWVLRMIDALHNPPPAPKKKAKRRTIKKTS